MRQMNPPWSNQYRRRSSSPPSPQVLPGLFTQASISLPDPVPPVPSRCGGIWGGECTEPVGPPDWACREHPRPDQTLAALARPECPPEILSWLSNDLSPAVRWEVANNPSTPPETLGRLGDDKHTSIRKAVAAHSACPPGMLEKLCHDESWEVRNSVARNPAASPGVLRMTGHDRASLVRASTATNPSCPPEMLRLLAQRSAHRQDGVRQSVAGNPSCPSDMLRVLALDDNPAVRLNVARHPNTGELTLQTMIHDPEPQVARTAAGRLAAQGGKTKTDLTDKPPASTPAG